MARTYLLAGAAFLGMVLFVDGGSAHAQRKGFSGDANKNNSRILDLFKSVIAKPAASTVVVQIDGKQAALGTIVDADGYIITKDSELRNDKIVVKFREGKELAAHKIASNDDYDLARLKVDAKDLTPVSWSFSKVAPVGNWVTTPGLADRPLAIGVVSVAARTMPPGPKFALPSGGNRGFLGIKLAPDEGGVRITSVEPKAAAEKAGLKADDIILSVDGRETPDPMTLSATIGRYKPGDTVSIRFRRGAIEEELKAKLQERPASFPVDRSDLQNSMGTSRSERRTGFPIALQHDSDLKASQCGGPLVDIEGRVIGINIARGGRTDTYAIPAETILTLLPDLMKGKSSVASKLPFTLPDRIKSAEAALKTAEAAKSAAEKELAKAKAVLEKLLAEQKKLVEKKEKEKKDASVESKKEQEKKVENK
jgi:serine protease Do